MSSDPTAAPGTYNGGPPPDPNAMFATTDTQAVFLALKWAEHEMSGVPKPVSSV